MKVFQLRLFYCSNKNTPLKSIIFPIILMFCLFSLRAQEDRNIKLKIETGLLMTSENSERLGLFFRVEPKLKTSKNTVLGLRIGASINEQIFINYDLLKYNLHHNINTGLIQFISPNNGLISVVPTFDYHFSENNFSPYLGLGIGYYFLANYTAVSRRAIANPSEELLTVSVQNQIGFLLRGGLELSKIIVGLEFNFIPKAKIEIPNGQIIGRVDNSYIGLSIGYAIGIGKSLKQF